MAQLRPTFSESWYRVAGLKARLRGSTQISRQHYRGERWYVVRDPAGNQYHRLSSAAYRFVGMLDGSRTVGEAWDAVGGQLADDAPTQPEVIQILSQLHAANLLEANITADATVLLRRHKQNRKRQMQGKLMNFLFPRIPLWDPDRFLQRWMPVMKVFLSKFGAFLWFAVVIGALIKLAPMWPQLKEAGRNAINFQTNSQNYIYLFFTFVGIKLIHELGHAFSCRRFGGEVHELGIMFLVFIPAPYVDASSAWALPNKWTRAFVGMGGMVFELFVAAVMAFVWAYTRPDMLVHQFAYNAMLIASVSTLVFNANPLLRYDGYYILSDLLEIPNLRQKSMDYSLGLIKRHVFGVKNPIPLPPPGQRVWLFLYAIASGIYRVMVGVVIILVVSGQVPVLGILMALGGLVTWLVVPIFKISNYLLLEPELHRKRGRAVAFTLAVATIIVIGVGVLQFPVHFRAMGVVEAQRHEVLRADYPGFVTAVRVHDGEVVHGPMKFWRWTFLQGTPLVQMKNDDLNAQIVKLHSEVEEAKLNIQMSTALNQAQRNIDVERLQSAQDHLDLAVHQRERMTVRADIAGPLVVVAPNITELQGKYLREGEAIATVQRAGRLIVRAVVPQDDAAQLELQLQQKNPEDPEVRLAGRRSDSPWRVDNLRGVIEKGESEVLESLRPGDTPLLANNGGTLELDPNDPDKRRLTVPHFVVRIALVDPLMDQIHPVVGQTANVRFTNGKGPLIEEWWRKFMQVVQTQSSHNKWL